MQSAVVVIDVQRGLFDPQPAPDEADAVVGRINALTARARSMGVLVVFVLHERPDSALAYGSEGWQLVPALAVGEGDAVVRKTTPDSFHATDLQALLEMRGVRELVICGYASEFCVDTTVRRAAALGYAVTLAADAHTTHDKPHASAALIRAHHNATLSNITSFGPRIVAVPSAQVAFDEPIAATASV